MLTPRRRGRSSGKSSSSTMESESVQVKRTQSQQLSPEAADGMEEDEFQIDLFADEGTPDTKRTTLHEATHLGNVSSGKDPNGNGVSSPVGANDRGATTPITSR